MNNDFTFPYSNDKYFLKQLDLQNLKTTYVKIVILDNKEKEIISNLTFEIKNIIKKVGN